MSGTTRPSSTSRGFVACTLTTLALIGLYTAAYRAEAWMWLVWSILALVTILLVATDSGR